MFQQPFDTVSEKSNRQDEQSTSTTIDYAYDPLYRLTAADYSTGDYHHYTYDSVGNRLTETTHLATKNYVYDEANRLTSVDDATYTWDANGNLLNDGTNTYTYDSANRLIAVNNQSSVTSYQYNGLGDRLTQNDVHYTLDTSTSLSAGLNAGLTQVLDDGENTYLYGNGRIAQTGSTTEYFLGDALGSVRQLTNEAAEITLTKSYAPYGEEMSTSGSGQSEFAFTGEAVDANGLVYLRARYYASDTGRFLSRDTWEGDANNPITYNHWAYANANPANLVDSSGRTAGFVGQNGYSEGEMGNFTGLFANWVVRGEELVYDFETLERAKFSLTARIDESTGEEHWVSGVCLSFVAISGATYTSTIFGFDHDDGIVVDYGGVSKSVGGGLNFIVPGAGAFLFSSIDRETSAFNWDVWGISTYQELGVGVSVLFGVIEAGLFVTEYHLADVVKTYNNIDEMAQDIVKGEGSPINTYIGLKAVRENAAEWARQYRMIRK